MSLLSAIKSVAKTAVSTVSKAINAPLPVVKSSVATIANVAVNIATHPVAAVKAATSGTSPAAFAATYTSQPLAKQITNEVIAGAGYIAAAVTGGAVAEAIAAKGIVGAASSLIPASITGKVAIAVAAPVAVGLIASNPLGVGKAAASTPAALGNVGVNIGNFAANPTIANAEKIVTDNPVIAGTAAAATALAIGKAAIPAAASFANTVATRANTAAVEAGGTSLPTEKVESPAAAGLPIAATPPITPQTVSLDTPTTTTPSNSGTGGAQNRNYQKVNVLINQKIANKTRKVKYINKRKHK